MSFILSILDSFKSKSLLNLLLYPEVHQIKENVENILTEHIEPLRSFIKDERPLLDKLNDEDSQKKLSEEYLQT